ncbi:MAG: DNA-directed RNA polymerase [Candidatus Aenigmatarchaeota archaeon]
MYKRLEVKDTVRVDPEKFGMDLEDSVYDSLKETYEGILNPDIGLVLSVNEVSEIGEGNVLPEDGAVYYPAEFEMLVFEPQEHEVVIGEVVDVTEFGGFVRIGPIDALIHISQVMDDYVNYDEKNNALEGKESGKRLRNGDLVRARIISVSYSEDNKVGLTMKQPRLGALKWLEEDEEEEE